MPVVPIRLLVLLSTSRCCRHAAVTATHGLRMATPGLRVKLAARPRRPGHPAAPGAIPSSVTLPATGHTRRAPPSPCLVMPGAGLAALVDVLLRQPPPDL